MGHTTTSFAPLERATLEQVMTEHEIINENEHIQKLFSALPDAAAVLNAQRQIVYCNEVLLEMISPEDRKRIFGRRPGEAINCIHASETKDGCGTSENCRYCGAAIALFETEQEKKKVQKECRILSRQNSEEIGYDLQVTATPVVIRGKRFTYVFIKDISAQKRRKALERIFFHDITNTAGGILGFAGFLRDVDDPETLQQYVKVVDQLSHDLIDEIQAQRALTLAENNDLTVQSETVNAYQLLEDVKHTVSFHAVAEKKDVTIQDADNTESLTTDKVLLKRVILNMVKNALEASHDNDKVSIGFTKEPDGIVFFVQNNEFMPREVQLQVFKRSFSTKGKDRGLGTYSIKLLTEKYLRGKVWFETDETKGTIFSAKIPFCPE